MAISVQISHNTSRNFLDRRFTNAFSTGGDPHKINIFLGAIHNRGCSFRGFYNRPDFIAFPLLMPLGEPLISP